MIRLCGDPSRFPVYLEEVNGSRPSLHDCHWLSSLIVLSISSKIESTTILGHKTDEYFQAHVIRHWVSSFAPLGAFIPSFVNGGDNHAFLPGCREQ